MSFKHACLFAVSALALSTAPVLAQTAETTEKEAQKDAMAQLSLGKIVVSAGKEKVATDTPQSVTVIDQEDLENAQAGTVGELLKDVAGVDSAGGVSSLGQGLNIRGMGTALSESDSRVVFTVDGVTKFFEGYRMGSLFTDTELYKRVEVLRGPSSSTVYGSGALAGTVNFTTKDASDFLTGDDNFAVRLKGGYDSNTEGSLISATLAAKPVQNLDLLLVANKRDFGNYTDGNGRIVNPSQAAGESVLVKTRYYIGGDRKHSVWASAQTWTDDSWQMYDQQAAFTASMVRRQTDDTNYVIGYDNSFEGNDWLDLKAQIAFDESKTDQRDNQFSPTALGYRSQYSYKTIQAKVENVSTFDTGVLSHFLTVGVQTYNQERRNPRYNLTGGVTNGATTHPEGDMNRVSLYVQDEILIGDKLTLIPGIRYDKSKLKPGAGTYVVGLTGVPSSVELDALSPKLAVLYAVTDTVNVFGSLSHTERLPVLDEIYTRGAAQTISLNLKPEESENKEIGASYTKRGVFRKSDGLNLKLTLYQNDIRNLVTRTSTTASAYTNVGEARYEGAELEAEYASRRFFSRAAYSTVNGYDKATNIPFNTIPAEQLNLTTGWVIPEHGVTFGWRGEFADRQYSYSTAGATRGNVSATTKSYSVHNLFVSYRAVSGPLEGIEARLNWDNIFDEYYQPHLSYLPSAGQTFRLSLAKTF
ncbi:TonB-dependent receptor domain-containing protein [Asticcacaulis sp. AND118]|uniref:TonB-dependent receptor domain-containing protein n=1 Tax=Asticcacaulis sp. AND118 TaxID=2840468 RepID=UPI001CFFD507|nr:TonB-dependent receptor [Asticcacaulis sp. AND118]UDF05033.1 TonB-dependent receptor [Asticcacaulis sp. AND118]